LAAASADESPFIIGGGEIYKLALPHATHIELTRVEGSFKADAYFPELPPDQWTLTGTQAHSADERHEHAFVFETYQRQDTA
jgi:dihydrofolate reductase (EC 1.5.1.3)